MLFLSAPTVIMALDISSDTSVFFSVAEEENENNSVVKHLEVHVSPNHKFPFDLELGNKKVSNFYLVCNRSSLSLQTFSPPPEQQV